MLAAAALLALSGALALPAAAQAQEIALVSNIAEASNGGLADVRPPEFTVGGTYFGERRAAQRFTTGPNTAGYTLQSVVLNLGAGIGTAPVVHVAIHGYNSSGNPGTLLAVLDNPADPIGNNTGTAGNRTFSAPNPLSLASNSQYWVVVSNTATTDSSFSISLTRSNDQTTTHEFSIRDSRLQGTPGSWTADGRTVVKMEVRGTLAPPTVTSVVVASAPQSGDTYRSYETIVFTVTFSEPVKVTPGRLRLKVGLDNPGGASGSTVEAVFSGLSQSQRPTADTPQARLAPHMHFEYKVQLFDRDENGVRIGANALRLASGARIQGELGADADLDHAALGTLSDHKVDGTADVPMIRGIEVVSTPRLRSKGTTTRDTYGEGENIRIEVRFDQPVVVEGEPTFALEVGNPCLAVCEAYYESGSGTNTLVFAYLVLEVDIDRNGIAIRGNPIEVVSGDSISNAADQEAHLSSKGKGTQRGHKVDGSRAAPSYLSVEDAEAHEADGEMEFTVRLEPHGLGIVTVDYATADGTGSKAARAGSDYTETSGTLTFNSLETERTVSVPIMDDAHEDDGETFTLTLSNPDGAKLRSGDGEATGTIRNSEIQPLTATFEDVPSAHDGSAFTFRMAFSEDIGISYRALREDALAVTGGRVTRGARVDDRRDLFEMTVAPDGAGAVSITLEEDRECGVSGAICTKGENRRQLTNTPAATVAGPAVETGPAGLTARFARAPAEHDGKAFTLRIAFSETIRMSGRRLRSDVVSVAGGRATKARPVNGRKDLWKLTVKPDSLADVTVTLAAGAACDIPAAVCTADGKALSHTLSTTVRGPVAVSVADARAREGEDETIDFAVSLSRAASGQVSVTWATADGSATAGEDYTHTSGKLRFDPGETERMVRVPVLDDAIDEGEETFTLRLVNASGAVIADGVATGTIENSDPLQKMWLSRFGRTVAGQVVDAVAGRLSGTPGGSRVTLGGRSIDLSALSAETGNARRTLAGALGAERSANDDDPLAGPRPLEAARAGSWADPGTGGTARGMTGRELLLGSSFHLAAGGGEAGGPGYAAWGRMAVGGFDAEAPAEKGTVRLDGKVTTGILGADAQWERWLAGVALSVSEGEGTFDQPGVDSGTVESTLTSVNPYVRYQASDRLSAWGLLGYGTGDMTIRGNMVAHTDISMRLGAAGARGVLLEADEGGGIDLALRGDAFLVQMESVKAANTVATKADASRLRLVLEGGRSFALGEGAVLTPALELGLRHDGGDAETGTGVEVGGSIRYTDTRSGLTVEANARKLIAHEDSGYEEWGAGGSVRLDPGASGRGLSLSLAPVWGTPSSGVERLWSARDAAGLVRDDDFEAERRLEGEVGYGFSAPRGLGVVTPYAGLSLADGGGRAWRMGARWQVMPDLTLGLEGTRREAANDEAPQHGLMLRGAIRW